MPLENIRASSLILAQYCPGAPQHLHDHPVERADLSRGSKIHQAIQKWIEEEVCDESIKTFAQWLLSGEVPAIDSPVLHAGKCEKPVKFRNITGTIDWVGYDKNNTLTIIDWKTGFGQHYIRPPINRDLQLLAYGCAAGMEDWAEEVRILRIHVDLYTYEEFLLEDVPSQARKLSAIAKKALQDPQKIVGPHCEGCLARYACEEWQDAGKRMLPVVATPTDLTVEQAIAYAIARGRGGPLTDSAVKRRLEDLDRQILKMIENAGVLETSGYRLEMGKPSIRLKKHKEAIDALREKVGKLADTAVEIIPQQIRTSKSKIEAALKEAGLKPAERKQFFESLLEREICEEGKPKWKLTVTKKGDKK